MTNVRNEICDRDRIYVLTRYAVDIGEKPFPPAHDWLDERLELLQKFTARSLLGQSYSDFRWLLFLDERLRHYEQRLKIAAEGLGEVVIVGQGKGLEESLKEHIGYSHGPLLSMRLDSDDCLHRDFLMRARVSCKADSAIGFLYGAGLDVISGSAWRVFEASNSFLMYHSLRGDSVFALGDHNSVWKSGLLNVKISRNPLWLRIIHGGNVANNRPTALLPVRLDVERWGLEQATVSKQNASGKQFFVSASHLGKPLVKFVLSLGYYFLANSLFYIRRVSKSLSEM